MPEIESFQFYKGINRRKSRLYLADGECYTHSGYSLDHDGRLGPRDSKTQGYEINDESTLTINGIHRYRSSIMASCKQYCDGDQTFFNYIYQRGTSDTSWTNIGIMAGDTRPRFADYEKFIFAVDGESKRAYINSDEYEWHIANPETAPVCSVGAAGNPSATYTCTVTFYIIFPNGKVYETAASPSTEVTLASEKCEWSEIPVCPFTGDGLVIHRRLYRTVSGTAYRVDTIQDNTTTSYSDDNSDTTLQANTAYGTTSYSTPPDYMVDLEVHSNRMFGIKDNTLYWSETYAPWAWKTTSSGVVTKEDEDLTGIIAWGDQLYMVSKSRWYRLQGSDPDTWAIKRTFTDHGVMNRHTLQQTKWGILGLDYEGIRLFDGAVSINITEKILGRTFFTDLDDLDVCWATFDNDIYYFYYASSGSTLDSCLRLDFRLGRANLRIHHGAFVDANEFHKETGTRYQANDGYEYTEGGTETIAASLIAGDKTFGNLAKRKNLEFVKYDIDTGGDDVTLTIYVDGSADHTITLDESSRTRKRVFLPQLEGYRFAIGISCADATNVTIYEPWFLEATLVGE